MERIINCMNIPKELQELRANVDSLLKQYKEIKAQPISSIDPNAEPDDTTEDPRLAQLEDLIFNLVGYVHQRVTNLENAFYDYGYTHQQGHFPAVKSPSQMEAALKTLGLDKDYIVAKPTISVANKVYGFEIK